MADTGLPASTRGRVRWDAVLGAALLAAYGAFLVRHAAFAVGGSDSSGYANVARRLKSEALVSRPRSLERLSLPDEWAQNFIPLGFMNGPRPGTMAPLYPPGFPAHLLAAASIAGWRIGPYLVSPIAAVLSALLIYLLGRDLGLPSVWALAAAAIFAAWPVLVFQALQPMSDVVATFWTIAAVFCARRTRRAPAWALGAGAAFGVAVLVRSTNAVLLLALACALPMTIRALTLFAAGGLPFAGLFAAYNFRCYGAAWSTGYGKSELLKEFALSQFPARIRYYTTELLSSFTPLVPLAWLAVPADRRLAARDRLLLCVWFGSYLLLFSFYLHYGSIVFLRFLLPGVPALILGAALVGDRVLGERRASWTAVAALICVGVVVLEWRGVRRDNILEIVADQSVYPESCLWTAETVPPGAIVVAMQASGALEYYTDLTYVRWNWLDPQTFAKLREATGGEQRPWFALVFPVDAEEVRKRIPGHWTILGEKRGVALWRLDP